MKRIKYQKLLVTVGSATASGTTSQSEIQLDSSYTKCTGIQIQEISDGGITNGFYRVGIKDDNQVYLDVVHKNVLLGGTNPPPKDRFMPITIDIRDGIKTQVQVNNPASLSSDLQIEVVFRLEDERAAI